MHQPIQIKDMLPTYIQTSIAEKQCAHNATTTRITTKTFTNID